MVNYGVEDRRVVTVICHTGAQEPHLIRYTSLVLQDNTFDSNR